MVTAPGGAPPKKKQHRGGCEHLASISSHWKEPGQTGGAPPVLPAAPRGVSLRPPGHWEGARPPPLPREIFMARTAELI